MFLKDLNLNKCNAFGGYPKEDYNDHYFSNKILDHIKNLVLSCYKDDIFYQNTEITTSFNNYYEDLNKDSLLNILNKLKEGKKVNIGPQTKKRKGAESINSVNN